MAFVKVKLSNGSGGSGADMGRQNTVPEAADGSMPPKLTLVRLRWVDGDYDSGGAYWGGGESDFIYRAHGYTNQTLSEPDGEEVEIFVRAKTRKKAKAEVRKILASVKFVKSKDRITTHKHANEFAQAFITALLWSSNDMDTNEPLDKEFKGNPQEFEAATWNQLIDECAKFEKENAADIKAGMAVLRKGNDVEHAGHDFALTRNGHGSGFWDGDWPEEAGKRMTASAKKFGEVWLYKGEDGKLYS